MLDFWIHDFIFPFLSVEDTNDFIVTEQEVLESLEPNNERVAEENKEGAAAAEWRRTQDKDI